VELSCGLDREATVETIVSAADAFEPILVGLDFAFSFPRWFAEENGWTSLEAVWDATERHAEDWLAHPRYPFWGRPGQRDPGDDPTRAFRRTERDIAAQHGFRPKSVFQVGGRGAVGTGSLRGMKHLAGLRRRGFAIWPFDRPAARIVVEIYPRLLTGRVVKSKRATRERYLDQRFRDLDPTLRDRAISSEDAFDAAVSGLVMSRHVRELQTLERSADGDYSVEGRVWAPGCLA
jgi:hypothetical protein